MTVYMNRLFRKSNSSFLLSTAKSIKASVSPLKEETYLITTGISTPKITPSSELLLPATSSLHNNDVIKKFENKVGFIGTKSSKNESPIKTQMLERMFMDLVAGDPAMKDRALARFNDVIGGSSEGGDGDVAVMMPRRFRSNQAWMEMKKMWTMNKKVKGFLLEKVKGGYSVGIGGYIAFVPYRPYVERRNLLNDKFTIESVNSKRKKITVF